MDILFRKSRIFRLLSLKGGQIQLSQVTFAESGKNKFRRKSKIQVSQKDKFRRKYNFRRNWKKKNSSVNCAIIVKNKNEKNYQKWRNTSILLKNSTVLSFRLIPKSWRWVEVASFWQKTSGWRFFTRAGQAFTPEVWSKKHFILSYFSCHLLTLIPVYTVPSMIPLFYIFPWSQPLWVV